MNTEQINRFDELMREKLNSYEAEPDMELLHEVYARKNRFLRFKNMQKLIILLCLLGVGILGGYLIAHLSATQHSGNTGVKHETETNIQPTSKSTPEKTSTSSQHLNSEMHGTATSGHPTNAVAGVLHQQAYTQQHSESHFLQEQQRAAFQLVETSLKTNHTTTQGIPAQPSIIEPASNRTVTTLTKEEACNAKFTYYTNYDGSVQFTPIITEATNGIQFTWSFGDGSESHKNNPKHQFAKPGAYAVVLTIYNKERSCKAEYAQLVRIDESVAITTTNISGTVFANAEYANHLQIDLLEYNYKTNDYEWVQSTFTNNKGYYEFSEVTAGNYMILTARYKNYLPTFYGNNTDKNYATTLSVFADDYTHLSGYDIQLSTNPMADNTRTASIDTSKTILLVFDENNNPIASIEVSKNGSTNGGNLPSGNYKLVNPTTGEPAGDLEVSNGRSKIKVPDASGVGGSANSGALTQNQLSLMPNPAVNSVTVGLTSSENASIEITIINNQGAVIKRLIIPAGNQRDNIDVSELSPGNYYVIARQNGSTTTKTLVKSIDNSK